MFTNMKYFFLICLSHYSFLLFGQDTTFYDNRWQEVADISDAAYYRITLYKENKVVGLKYYFASGQLKFEADESFLQNSGVKGKLRRWYANGQLRTDENRFDGKLTDTLRTYYENGAVKRIEVWKDAQVVTGNGFDVNGQTVSQTPYIIEPSFPGGKDALYAYLGKEIKHPKKSLRYGIDGEVNVQFTVLEDGSLANFHVLLATDSSFGQEALRVMKKMPKWDPGYIDDKREPWEYVLPIKFKIEVQQSR